MDNLNKNIELIVYDDKNTEIKNVLIDLVTGFWKEHNGIIQSREESLSDIKEWSKSGHILYLVKYNNLYIGFAHLGARGCEIDWLEDIFILPVYQRKGIGSIVIDMLEDIVKEYSECLYIEVATRNLDALRLYNRLGYDTLNTITIRKDFKPDKYKKISNETINGLEFDIKCYKD